MKNISFLIVRKHKKLKNTVTQLKLRSQTQTGLPSFTGRGRTEQMEFLLNSIDL